MRQKGGPPDRHPGHLRIKLFWEKSLRRRWPAEVQLVRANPRFKLPVVLSAEEVRAILAQVGQLDHRVALITLSCNDRHCPQCGQDDADQWLEAQSSRLLPVDYFLVTFTVPEGLRAWMRSHPGLGYDALFAASAAALRDVAANPDRLGAQLGMWGVLHTWSRTLIYHPQEVNGVASK